MVAGAGAPHPPWLSRGSCEGGCCCRCFPLAAEHRSVPVDPLGSVTPTAPTPGMGTASAISFHECSLHHSWLSKTVLTVLRSWRKTRGCARPGGALGRGCGLNAAFASTCPDPARFLLWKTRCLQQNTVQWVRTEGVKCSARCSGARNWFLMQPEICQQLRIAPGDGGVYVAVTRVTACSQQPWPPIPPPGP